jgi:uncharacterized membrane protein
MGLLVRDVLGVLVWIGSILSVGTPLSRTRSLGDGSTYMHAHWGCGKLTLVLIIVALHHLIGAKAKKAHTGSVQSAKSGGILSLALLCASTLTVLLVLLKAALIP